ncbi:diguanylate cyclase [Clostridium sp. MCC353]|uniref:sensor domain-containing diguanylate cyclase n=1 Tax=Clostridium sp. MCC353 TaxID=2592646 RepID=UPI001C01E552|nr:sensor domain-containing diguanylate cyclase [Clostridium sp. MCC353]MBT9778177.1 diguanylate cyclase [Clostridium sp. MCC353]
MLKLFFKHEKIIILSVAGAVFLIFCTLFVFRRQVNQSTRKDMKDQIEAIQKNCVREINNEMDSLKYLNETTANFMSGLTLDDDSGIADMLDNYARSAHIKRTLFITFDGDIYTNSAEKTGLPPGVVIKNFKGLSAVRGSTFTQPWYSEELGQMLFGVISPMSIGDQAGLLISAHPLSNFYDLFQNDFLGGTSEIGILNQDGTTILGRITDDHRNEFGLNAIDALINGGIIFSSHSADGMLHDFRNGVEGYSSYYVSGTERLCSYAPVRYNGWYVVVIAQESILREQSVQMERHGIWLAVKLIFIMAVLLAIILFARLREQKQVREQLQKAAMMDGMTGILNRGTAENQIIRYLKQEGKDKSHAVFLIDVDCFKAVNDTYGHITGDCILRELAEHLQKCFGPSGLIGRMGGDEFIVLWKDCGNMEMIQKQAERLLTPLSYSDSKNGVTVPFTISVGISRYKEDGETFIELYQHADEALYHTKQNGRNGYSIE